MPRLNYTKTKGMYMDGDSMNAAGNIVTANGFLISDVAVTQAAQVIALEAPIYVIEVKDGMQSGAGGGGNTALQDASLVLYPKSGGSAVTFGFQIKETSGNTTTAYDSTISADQTLTVTDVNTSEQFCDTLGTSIVANLGSSEFGYVIGSVADITAGYRPLYIYGRKCGALHPVASELVKIVGENLTDSAEELTVSISSSGLSVVNPGASVIFDAASGDVATTSLEDSAGSALTAAQGALSGYAIADGSVVGQRILIGNRSANRHVLVTGKTPTTSALITAGAYVTLVWDGVKWQELPGAKAGTVTLT